MEPQKHQICRAFLQGAEGAVPFELRQLELCFPFMSADLGLRERPPAPTFTSLTVSEPPRTRQWRLALGRANVSVRPGEPTGTPTLCSLANCDGDVDLRGRNCDRAVKWSPRLKSFEQIGTFLLGYAFQLKLQANTVEHAQVRAHGIITIDLACHYNSHPAES